MSNNITNDKIDILSLNLEKLQEVFVITGLKKNLYLILTDLPIFQKMIEKY